MNRAHTLFSETSLMPPVQISANIEKTPTDVVLGCRSTVCRNQRGRHKIPKVTGDHARSGTPRAIGTFLYHLQLRVSDRTFQRSQPGAVGESAGRGETERRSRIVVVSLSALMLLTCRSSGSLGHPKSPSVPSSTQRCVQRTEARRRRENGGEVDRRSKWEA